MSSQLVSVETSVKVDASEQSGGAAVTVAKHRLFIEWTRHRVYSMKPGSFTELAEPRTYVSGIEYGVGIRIILNVTLTDVSADANLQFGFGKVAASVATGNAQVDVQYDTIGIAEDILPENLPISIESVNDITTMMRGLYGAVEEISAKWNKRVKAAGPTSEVIDDESGRLPTPRIPEPKIESVDQEKAKALVRDVGTAKKVLEKLPRPRGSSTPQIDVPEFEAIKVASERGTLTVEQEKQLIKSLAEYYESLKKLEEAGVLDDLATKLAGVPESLREPDALRKTLDSYYPDLVGNESLLFPAGFSAGPVAYLIARTPDRIQRDHCENIRMSVALSGRKPTGPEKSECEEYWDAYYSHDEVVQQWCEAKLLRYTEKNRLPPKIGRAARRCGWKHGAVDGVLKELRAKREGIKQAYRSSQESVDAVEASLKKGEIGKARTAYDAAKNGLTRLDGLIEELSVLKSTSEFRAAYTKKRRGLSQRLKDLEPKLKEAEKKPAGKKPAEKKAAAGNKPAGEGS